MFETVAYERGMVRLLDQTLLPAQCVSRDCRTVEDLVEAIIRLRVRGAPAIGVAAAHGVTLASDLALAGGADGAAARNHIEAAARELRGARPTAVNLAWAVDRMLTVLHGMAAHAPAEALRDALAAEAAAIHREDAQMCHSLGRHGAALLPDPCTVMTHCNAGALATAGIGTALGVIYAAAEAGKRVQVIADETRPLLQGARLTAWELAQRRIPVTLICDGAAGWTLRTRQVDAVIVGADRIAANGDVANKIGTYGLAVLARRHGVPFYVAAPTSTLDRSLPDGTAIPIEERAGEEVAPFWAGSERPGPAAAASPPPQGRVQIFNPAFDVTPAELVSAIVTEQGVLRPPLREAILGLYGAVHGSQS